MLTNCVDIQWWLIPAWIIVTIAGATLGIIVVRFFIDE